MHDADRLRYAALSWRPPPGWGVVRTVDAHAAGEPLRVILEGLPPIQGEAVVERWRWARAHLEALRRALLWEPRGHADMYGALLVPPDGQDADLGVLFLHNEGWSTMCGHGIVALTRVLVETGAVEWTPPRTTVRFDTPAGRVVAVITPDADGRPGPVRFRNVPSFVVGLDLETEVDGLGRVRFDVAYGGAYYAYVDADALGMPLEPEEVPRLVDAARRIKRTVAREVPLDHPGPGDLGFLYGTIFVSRSSGPGAHSRNVCVFAQGEVDRSPTGTGVSGRAAIHHARGELEPGRAITIESLVGSRFSVRVVEEIRVADRPAVVPEVEGTAHLTGRHEFWIDPEDPLGAGFLVR